MNKPKLIYLAGPYRHPNGINGIFENIMLARSYARLIWMRGDYCICPHLNTMLMDANDVPCEVWLDGDIEMLKRCDGIAMLPGWRDSAGSVAEHEFATLAGLPVEYL